MYINNLWWSIILRGIKYGLKLKILLEFPFPHYASNPSINSFRCTQSCLPPACLPDSKRNYEQKRFPHTWLPSPYHYYSEERRVPSNQKYTQLNRACPANDNCREWHTFPSQASQIKPGCSGPSVTRMRVLLLLNTRSWFQYLRATMRLISQSSRCVIRHCSTICHTRTKTKHNYPPMLIKRWDMKALLFWRGGQSGLYMCV